MYKVRVYVEHGYFEYEVPDMSSALSHSHIIMKDQVYRRSVSDEVLEFHHVLKVKVHGPGLGSQYTDTFKRT